MTPPVDVPSVVTPAVSSPSRCDELPRREDLHFRAVPLSPEGVRRSSSMSSTTGSTRGSPKLFRLILVDPRVVHKRRQFSTSGLGLVHRFRSGLWRELGESHPEPLPDREREQHEGGEGDRPHQWLVRSAVQSDHGASTGHQGKCNRQPRPHRRSRRNLETPIRGWG